MLKPVFATKAAFTPADPIKIRYNVGGLLDIPVGTYVKGMKGEHILSGG